jgi:tetratricopeptide (TPR) repeat protein
MLLTMIPRPALPPLRRLFLFVGLLALGASGAVAAEKTAPTSPGLALRAAAHADFDRLVFDGPRGLTYEVHRNGARITVQFAVAASIDIKPAARLTRARDFAAGGGDKLAVSFTVAPQALVKDFVSGSSIVIDISGPPVPSAPAIKTVTTPAPPPPAPEPAKPAPEKTEAAKTETPQAAPQPEAPKETTPEATAAVPAPASVQAPTPEPAPSQPLPVLDLSATPELVVTLDPKIVTGAAIFARAGFGTILFDHKLTLGQAALSGSPSPRIRLEPLDMPHNSGFRFTMPENAEIRATRTGTAWQIYLVKQRDENEVTTGLVAQPEFALGARLLLPTTQAPEPVRFTDPVVGDDLIVVPLRETEAFSVPRRMADLAVIPSAQGLVVKPLHEKVVIRAVSDGVEITSEGGLSLSPASDTGAALQNAKKARAAAAGKSLFDFAVWQGKPNETFTDTRQKLMQTIVDVPEQARNLARLELAHFYFSHGMGAETLALLSILAKLEPDMTSHAEFVALRGAARILAGHPQEGLQDLSHPDLALQPEIHLWMAVGAANMRDWQTAEERFALAEDILTSYPEPFYSRFSVLAIEAAIAQDKNDEAAAWLDRMENQPHLAAADPAFKYLRGVLRSKTGKASAADSLWRTVSHGNDRLYKIRAELALIDLGVATHSLTPAQAIERLEGLRYAWRGDDLELDILHRLGGFYTESGNFRSGFATLEQAVHLYPNSPLTPSIRAEMNRTFRDIFLGKLGANLSPLEALTLYQDYSDLMPTGDDGNAVGRNLAERLVAIDLLDQASKLLEDQVKGSLKGEEKTKVGTRLAAIRLLDHRPDQALTALESSQTDGMPEALQSERLLLRARAMSEQKKYDDALALLQKNDSQSAKILRADITMRAQRWGDAAKALFDLIGPPPKPGEVVSPDQAQWLVNCAIALSLSNDMPRLDRLAIDYGAAMAATPQNDTFRVLTRPDKAGQMRDIAAAQSKITEVDMFRGFLDAYRGIPAAGKKSGK